MCWANEISVASGLFRALKAHSDFMGDSPFDVTPPQRSTVEGQIEIGGEDRRVRKFETSAERGDVANQTLPNQRTTVGDYNSRRRNARAGYSSFVHHMRRVRTNSL